MIFPVGVKNMWYIEYIDLFMTKQFATLFSVVETEGKLMLCFGNKYFQPWYNMDIVIWRAASKFSAHCKGASTITCF